LIDRFEGLVVDATDTSSLNDLITRARELEEVESTKTRMILDEWLGSQGRPAGALESERGGTTREQRDASEASVSERRRSRFTEE
jgi:hypothetical protein